MTYSTKLLLLSFICNELINDDEFIVRCVCSDIGNSMRVSCINEYTFSTRSYIYDLDSRPDSRFIIHNRNFIINSLEESESDHKLEFLRFEKIMDENRSRLNTKEYHEINKDVLNVNDTIWYFNDRGVILSCNNSKEHGFVYDVKISNTITRNVPRIHLKKRSVNVNFKEGTIPSEHIKGMHTKQLLNNRFNHYFNTEEIYAELATREHIATKKERKITRQNHAK